MPITEAERRRRQRYLCASDTPVILGTSPYRKTPTDIYWSKVEPLPDEEATVSQSVGNLLEGALLDYASEELGERISRNHRLLWHVAKTGLGAGLFAAHLDGIIPGKPEAIECKYVNGEYANGFGDAYTDEVPDHVLIQCQHQAYASDLERVWVAVAMAGYSLEFKLYEVPRDQGFIDLIVERGKVWWDAHVKAHVPPNGDSTPPMDVLRARYRQPGKIIVLDDRAMEIARSLAQVKGQNKASEEREENLKALIVDMMGDAEIGQLPNGEQITFKFRPCTRFNQHALKTEKPEVFKSYLQTTISRTLLGPWSRRS